MSGTDPTGRESIDPHLLISGYLEDKLTPEQFAELTSWLSRDRENARAFMRHCVMIDHIREEMRWDDVAGMQLEDADQADSGEDALHVLESLLEDEQKQPTVLVNMSDELARQRQAYKSGPLTKRDLAIATRFVLGQALRSRAALVGGIAAVLLIGVVLAIVFLTGGTDDVREIVEPPPTHVEPQVDPTLIVATLTGEYDAVWDRRPRRDLYAGQRLALTHGYAEITTARGSVVVLEAPCMVELIDTDNALQLKRGRLVAKVPPSGHGFKVDTPTARIIDYGTEFAVDVDADAGTGVTVFEGSVGLLARDEEGGFSAGVRMLKSNEAARVNDSQGGVVSVPFDSSGYVRAIPTPRFEALILQDAPLVFWRFDGADDNNRVQDLGLLGADGVLHGDISFEPGGMPGTGASRAARMQGVDDYMDGGVHPRLAQITNNDPLTIEAWVYVHEADAQNDDMFARIVSNRGVEHVSGFGLGVDRDGRWTQGNPGSLLFTWFGATDYYADHPVPFDQWVHVAAVSTRDGVVLYINGLEREIHKRQLSPPAKQQQGSSSPLTIGRNPPIGRIDGREQPWDGMIAELVIFDRALTSDQIRRHYEASINPVGSEPAE